jgi:hypothetical protein
VKAYNVAGILLCVTEMVVNKRHQTPILMASSHMEDRLTHKNLNARRKKYRMCLMRM